MIFVDDVAIQADVHNAEVGITHRSRWYHLISDRLDPEELHKFATGPLKLRRSYFQPGRDLMSRAHDPAHDHYDLTEGKRKLAIQKGAIPISAVDLGSIIRLKREALRFPQCGYALVQNRSDGWVCGLEWGQEAEDSPMVGAAAYGVGETIHEAITAALRESSPVGGSHA
jgi:hypothetical protein